MAPALWATPHPGCGFSPLHEGDTSVAPVGPVGPGTVECFSPLHEGDTSVALVSADQEPTITGFQSPSRGGHLRGNCRRWRRDETGKFQSPSRGGHLRGAEAGRQPRTDSTVSVPFTRGTPPWRGGEANQDHAPVGFSPLHEGDTSVARAEISERASLGMFQSPSRGGHLRGPAPVCREHT